MPTADGVSPSGLPSPLMTRPTSRSVSDSMWRVQLDQADRASEPVPIDEDRPPSGSSVDMAPIEITAPGQSAAYQGPCRCSLDHDRRGPPIKYLDTPRSNSDRELCASVGSTDASASLLAGVGFVGPKQARPLYGQARRSCSNPVARLSDRAGSDATNAYAVRAAEIVPIGLRTRKFGD